MIQDRLACIGDSYQNITDSELTTNGFKRFIDFVGIGVINKPEFTALISCKTSQ
jgi:hypothetical protein